MDEQRTGLVYGCQPVEVGLVMAVEQRKPLNKLVYLRDPRPAITHFRRCGAASRQNSIERSLNVS